MPKIIVCERRGWLCKELPNCRRPEIIEEAVRILKDGGLVVYPTDTLYALGADSFNPKAIGKIYEAKERPENLPIPLAADSVEMMEEIAEIDDNVKMIVNAFIPHPVTFVMHAREHIPEEIHAGSGKVAIRIPNHIFALEMIGKFGPVTTTSANLHGGHNPTSIRTAVRYLDEAADLYVNCGRTAYRKPSTVIDISEGAPEKVKIIRKGALSLKKVKRILRKFER